MIADRQNLARRSEQGLVSLLTVVFFMIFISLIVVGFITIVVEDQRQAIDSDLSASALAAARGGVEDAKRILIYCQQNPGSSYCTNQVLNSQDNCDLFKNDTNAQNLAGTLGMTINSTTGEGLTGSSGAEGYQQYFTCLTIQSDTPSVTTPVSSSADYIERIATTTPFAQLQVTWSGNGTPALSNALSAWPKLSNWNDVPVIQFQVIPFTSPISDYTALESGTRTLYVVPCVGVLCTNTNPSINYDARAGGSGILRASDVAPITQALCNSTGITYSCSTTLKDFSGGNPGGQQYYIRASILYANTTTLKLSPLDAVGNSVLLDNVRPWIDVTGRANDVYRRVHAEVSPAQPVIVPRNALDSAAPICKSMVVVTATGTNVCPQ